MTDEFSMYDAAYLLGALTPPDRAAFETHLAECQDCRRAVNQLAGMPGLLASVAPEHKTVTSDAAPTLPDTLLPRLLAEVQRTRFRRRWTTGLIGVAAAVVLVLLAVGLSGRSPIGGGSDNTAGRVFTEQMTPVSNKIPVRASVQLADKQWGTEITIWCTYEGTSSGHNEGPYTYTMIVTDKAGGSQQVAAWAATAGQPAVAVGSTSVPKSEIASVQVRGPSDIPLLSLTP